MNFDNPVYRKTTTTDDHHSVMIGHQGRDGHHNKGDQSVSVLLFTLSIYSCHGCLVVQVVHHH